MLKAIGKRQQGVGAGSAYIVVSFIISGFLTYVFHGLATRALGTEGYGPLVLLWNATFLTVQILWISGTQTLGRYVSERESRGEDWRPVVSSVRRWQAGLLAAFVLAALAASPLLTRNVFHDWWLTGAYIVAVALYAPEYFRRGLFNGHRQFSRMGAQLVAEASGRLLVGALLLAVGVGVAGPAAAIMLGPLIGVLAVRPAPTDPPERQGEPFSAWTASRFAAPVLTCMVCAQGFATGGVILVSLLGGTSTQVAIFGAALILTRIPQYVLSPAVESLLPHMSRMLATEGRRSFDRFALQAVGLLGLVGVLMVSLTWPLGEWAVKVFAGEGFDASRGVLVLLAALAAFYLLCGLLNQVLFARGLARLSALAWILGLPVSAVCLALFETDLLLRVAGSVVAGIAAVAALQTVFCLASRDGSSAKD